MNVPANLETRDLAVIVVGLLASIAAGVLSIGQTQGFVLQVEVWTALANAPIFLAAAYFIWRFKDVWGGEIARYLTIASVGLVIQMLTWIPHILWHIEGLPSQFAPGAYGFSGSFWLTFFHLSGPIALGITAYGFYMLSQVAE